MKAVGLYRYLPTDDPESLVDLVLENPRPSGRDLLVRVRAVSVNPVDVKTRAPKSLREVNAKVLGWDAAGVIESVGSDCTLFSVGDTVFYAGDYRRSGANSELHLVDERVVGPKPKRLNFAQAAALPLTGLTAWEALFERLGLKAKAGANSGRTLLIINAAGGVGSIATQLARWAGLTVVGTASRPESKRWVEGQGAHFVIDHKLPLSQQLKTQSIETINFILCLKDPNTHWEAMAETVAPLGSICIVDDFAGPVNFGLLHSKGVRVACENIFTRIIYQTSDLDQQHKTLTRLAELVDAGHLRTTLTTLLSPINAATLRDAHASLEQGRTLGKIVIEGFGEKI